MAHCFSLAFADESIFILGGEKDILNNVQVDKESRRGCLSQVYLRKLLFWFSIITRSTWRYTVILYFPTTTNLIVLVTKLLWILLSTATKTKIVTVAYDSFVRARHFTSSVDSMVTGIIVKSAHNHSVLCGLAFLSTHRNLCVTPAVSSLGTNLSSSLLVSGVSCHHLVVTATSSPWRCATSAGSSSRHVERLPRQVVGRVFIITCFKKVVGQTAIAVELGEARRFARFS